MAGTVADEIRQESSFGAEWQVTVRKWQEHLERAAQNGAASG